MMSNVGAWQMIECSNKVIQKDLEELVYSECPLELMSKSDVLVTGASGLIGAQIVRTLACANRIKNLDVRIWALVRDRKKAELVFTDLLSRNDVNLIVGDVNDYLDFEGNIDYIIHAASPTSSRYFVTNPVETILTAINGTKNVLELAKTKNIKSFVYLSSLEVYGVPTPGKEVVKEQDYGYIDPINIRSSYSEGKRMVECLCASYVEEYGVPVKIARLSQTFGAGVDYNDSRVFAEFARCAVEGRDIVLHTEGKTLRTYCYIKDAISAIFYIMLQGENGRAYNVTNKNTAVTIYEMAECVSKLFKDNGIKVRIDVPENIASFGYNPEMRIRLDSTCLEELGWKPTVDLKEMFLRMIKSFED